MKLHQVLIGAAPGDAITSMAFNIHAGLPEALRGSLFAVFPEQAVIEHFLGIGDIPRVVQPDDLVVYHASYGIRQLTPILMSVSCELIVIYHNITPSSFFADIDAEFATGLEYGREELRVLQKRTQTAIAVSSFNALDLHEAGYRDTHVIPVGLDPDRLTRIPSSPKLVAQLHERFQNGYIVAVSQFLPHKKLHEVVIAMYLLREELGARYGLVLVGTPRSEKYGQAVQLFAERLIGSDVWITGRISDQELKTIMSEASAYVGMSAHEGLSLPLVESMAAGVPAVVRSAGAISETAGDGAYLLAEDSGPAQLARGVEHLLGCEELRLEKLAYGYRRIEQLKLENNLRQFFTAIGL